MKTAVVVTTIAPPNAALRAIAKGCIENGFLFIVIGDEKSPRDFVLPGCDYYDLARQKALDFRFERVCPLNHYARKNIGYLIAIEAGAEIIIETDDDNIPRRSFWAGRKRMLNAHSIRDAGWLNVYRYFSDTLIWPRGLPLDAVNVAPPSFETLPNERLDCPIQQGLADADPDVDAIYRLLFPLPQSFRCDRRVALGSGSWCAFNSQNTTWWNDAFPLLYLPAFCSVRITDIWRSLVTQRLSWPNEWSLLFHEPSVYQERNNHNLMQDFADEVPGYLHNRAITDALESMQAESGPDALTMNLRAAYTVLVRNGFIDAGELELLEAWIEDVTELLGASLTKTPARTQMELVTR